jgi:hypothetical protein
MNDNQNQREIITNRDRDLNAIRAGLKLIPVVGEALEQLYFEKGAEARQRRLDATLQEVLDQLKKQNLDGEAERNVEGNEDFATFFSEAAQPISRSTNEDKRQRFRDLLFNSMLIPPGDSGWEDSMYCLELLQKIDVAGLYTLAMIVRADRADSRLGVARYGKVPRWLIVSNAYMGSEPIPVEKVGQFEEFKYSNILITKNIDSLKSETNLVSARNTFVLLDDCSTFVDFLTLTPSGQFLVKWTVADF